MQSGSRVIATTESNHKSEFFQYLVSEFERRRNKHSSYSIRAMAKQIGVSGPYLAKIFRGERRVTPAFVDKVAPYLDLTTEQIASYKEVTKTNRVNRQVRFRILSEDIFQAISQWFHFAILELTKTRGFRNDVTWIASSLSISETQASEAIQRLIRLGLLVRRNGKLRCGGSFSNAVDPKLVTEAQKSLQRSVLEGAINALTQTPIELRDQSSVTVVCAESSLPEIKERIKNFRRQLACFVESEASHGAERVYHLTVGFYPVSTAIVR